MSSSANAQPADGSQSLTSCIYSGNVRHRRFSPKHHAFNYRLYMLAINPDELDKLDSLSPLFGQAWCKPIRFNQKDYLRNDPGDLKKRIKNKVLGLGGNWQGSKVIMLVQARCFGIYFSPANFYFCFDDDNRCQYMLAEVSNTPWNERHYYLIDVRQEQLPVVEKDFHVSPFMDLAMQYHWKIKPISDDRDNLLIHIENRRKHQNNEKVFDATMQLTKSTFSAANLLKVWMSLPAMTVKIFASIYYQALKLWWKKIPYVPYPTNQDKSKHSL